MAVVVSAAITEECYKQIEDIVEQETRSRSQVVRILLEEALEARKNQQEARNG